MMEKSESKKKGRRRRRELAPPPPSEPVSRRNLRPRRGGRPIFDEFLSSSEDEKERGRRKLKLVLKLPRDAPARNPPPPRRFSDSDVSAASLPSSPSSESYVDDEEEQEEEVKPLKKRRVEVSAGSGQREKRRENVSLNLKRCVSGIPNALRTGSPLPDKRTLEVVLDKLQKKDTYGVFAEPVDPEELPDYHDVIEHPMDFGTVRKKLAKGVYRCFEQFEDDVFLICSNAMQYNAPDTIYFRQAHSIQEMARKKFQMLRTEVEHKLQTFSPPTSVKTEKFKEKTKNFSVENKLIKKPMCIASQEPVERDLFSGSALTSALNTPYTGLKTAQPSDTKKSADVNGHVDATSSLGESKSEKADEISARCSPSKHEKKVIAVNENCDVADNTPKEEPGVESDSVLSVSAKCSPYKLGRKSLIVDENRRATYNICNEEPLTELDPIFTAFEGETKELIAIGIHAEYSYARSLARFGGCFGSVAWKIASDKIQKALPAGVKFGPGWVGEYEPLPTPVLSFEILPVQHLGHSSKSESIALLRKSREDEDRTRAIPNGGYKDIQHLGDNSKYETIASLRKGREKDRTKTKTMPNGGSKVMQHLGDDSKSESIASLRKGRENEDRTKVIPIGGSRDMQIGDRSHVICENGNLSFNPVKEGTLYWETTQEKQGLFGIAAENKSSITFAMLQEQKDRLAVDSAKTYSSGAEHLQSCNSSSRIPAENALQRSSSCSEAATCSSQETSSRNKNFQPEPMKKHEMSKPGHGNAVLGLDLGGLSAGNVNENPDTNRLNTTQGFICNHQSKMGNNGLAHGSCKQNIDDPSRLLGLPARVLYQPNTSTVLHTPKQVLPPLQQRRREDSSAAAAAAQVWMSIGASAEQKPVDVAGFPKGQVGSASLYNFFSKSPTSSTGVKDDSRAKQFSQFLPQPIQVASAESQVKNHGFVIFPQLVGNDTSRVHAQSPWQCMVPNVQQIQQKPRTEMLPPDLNVSFQPPGSPVRQSTGISLDPQQPDLALQL